MTDQLSFHDTVYDLDSGRPMHIFGGVGHADSAIIAAATAAEYQDLADYTLAISEGRWGWSPRMKHCGNYDSGWPCERAGEWHRHFSANYPGEQVTVVTVYGPSWQPSPHSDARLLAVSTPEQENDMTARTDAAIRADLAIEPTDGGGGAEYHAARNRLYCDVGPLLDRLDHVRKLAEQIAQFGKASASNYDVGGRNAALRILAAIGDTE